MLRRKAQQQQQKNSGRNEVEYRMLYLAPSHLCDALLSEHHYTCGGQIGESQGLRLEIQHISTGS